MLQFETLVQLRRSLEGRIRETVKKGGREFKTELQKLMASLKKDAQQDMHKAEIDLRAASKKAKGDKANVSVNSVSTGSRKQRKVDKASDKASKNPDEDTTADEDSEHAESDAEESAEGDGPDDEEAEESGSCGKPKSQPASRSGRPSQLSAGAEEDDEDLFDEKFSGKASPAKKATDETKQTDKEKLGPEPGCKISDELQEMLGDVVSKHLSSDADSCLLSCHHFHHITSTRSSDLHRF